MVVAGTAPTVCRDARDLRRRPGILYLLHRSPAGIGGIERHTAAVAQALRQRRRVSVGYPAAGRLWLEVCGGAEGEPPRALAFPIAAAESDPRWDAAYRSALHHLLAVERPAVAHVHHLQGHSLSALDVLIASGARTFVSLRDYYLLCPSFNLQHKNGRYCGVPAASSTCDACLAMTLGWPAGALADRRRRVDALLRRADGVVVPNPTVLDQFARAFDVRAWRTHVHEHGLMARGTSREPLGPSYFGGRLRVAFLGTAQQVKGYGAFLRLADRLEGEPVELVHLGNRGGLPSHPRVVQLGSYTPDRVVGLLRDRRIHLVLLLARWPETYSHVLSEAMAAGIPVLGTDLGAVGERIRRHRVGWTVPVDDDGAVLDLVLRLVADRAALVERSRAAARAELPTLEDDAAGLMEIYQMPRAGTGTRRGPSRADRRHAETITALAADNAMLARRLDEARSECERLRRELGEAPRMSLGVDDIEATRVYRVALRLREAWLRLPYRVRRALERIGTRWS